MDHPARLDPQIAVQPWQRATVLLALVAVFELVLLIVAGGALLVKPGTAKHSAAKTEHASTAASAKTTPAHVAPAKQTKPAVAELPRRKVEVVVLNGNGRQGAAASAAARVRGRGYRVGLVGNAPSSDYPQTMVMYRRGFEGEGRRLATDLGVKIVSPLDGTKPAQLHGAQAVLILGG